MTRKKAVKIVESIPESKIENLIGRLSDSSSMQLCTKKLQERYFLCSNLKKLYWLIGGGFSLLGLITMIMPLIIMIDYPLVCTLSAILGSLVIGIGSGVAISSTRDIKKKFTNDISLLFEDCDLSTAEIEALIKSGQLDQILSIANIEYLRNSDPFPEFAKDSTRVDNLITAMRLGLYGKHPRTTPHKAVSNNETSLDDETSFGTLNEHDEDHIKQ